MADLGFHEGGLVKSGALERTPKFCKPRLLPANPNPTPPPPPPPPFTQLNDTLGVELGVCLRFILAACSLEVVYTGKIAISTVDTTNKKNMTVRNGYNNTSSL